MRLFLLFLLSSLTLFAINHDNIRKPNSSLINTYWKLMSIGESKTITLKQEREAHLILKTKENHVSGMGSCNRFFGSFQHEKSELTFSQMGGTMMMCPPNLMEQERDFHQVLQATQAYKISGENLELLDEQGENLAHFKAVYLY